MLNLTPLYTFVPKKVISVSDSREFDSRVKVVCVFHDFSSLFCLDLCSIGFWFGKVFMVTHAKSFFARGFSLMTSAFGQRSVGLQPTPKYPTAREKNPLVTRVRFNTTLSQYLVFYSGHEDVSKSNGHLRSHGCSMSL